MATTTPGAIRDAIVARIAGLTPPAPVTPRFLAHREESIDLRAWAVANPAACFRRFAVEVLDEPEPLVTPGAGEEQVRCGLEIVVAGKADQRFTDRKGIDDVLRADRRFINAHVGTTGRSAHSFDASATIVSLDFDSLEFAPGVVFAVIRLEATFHRTIP